jgi:hypothetical protein
MKNEKSGFKQDKQETRQQVSRKQHAVKLAAESKLVGRESMKVPSEFEKSDDL